MLSVDKVVSYSRFLFFMIARFFHQRHRYDYPGENKEWAKKGNEPVFGDICTGSVFDPHVVSVDNYFYMFVSERKNNSIIRVEANDGVNWRDSKTALKPMPGTWQAKVNRACVLNHKGLWHMWYTGQTQSVSSIGYAKSSDGLHFENAVSPCLVASLPQEGVSVMNPFVIWDDEIKLFRMWYAAGENFEPDVLFYAESYDGLNWEKRSEPVLTKDIRHNWEKSKIGGCHVMKRNGVFEMYYIGYQNVDVARICFASSKDGVNWIRQENNILIGPTKDGFDSDATYKPSVVEKQGKLYMWYNGRSGDKEFIGLATKSIKK